MLFRQSILKIFLALILILITSISSYSKETEYLIPVPEDCFKAVKIDANRIYLAKDKSVCTGIPVVKVKLPDTTEEVEVYIDNKFYKKHLLKDKTLEQSIEKFSNLKTDLKLPQNKEAEEKAKETYYYSQSEEFQKKVEEYTEQLKTIIFPEYKENIAEKYYPDAKTQKTVLVDDERVYVFISSSMPEETIRAYARDLEKLGKNAVLVMRGAIGGLKYITPTAQWATNILKRNQYCEGQCETYKTKIIIDPFLFRKYGINRVPAVVYTRGINNIDGSSEGLLKENNHFLISYGDVALSYHFKMMSEKSKNIRLKTFSEILN